MTRRGRANLEPCEDIVSGSEPARRTGEVLGGKYRLVQFIGEGGMGAVYEAQHAIVGRRFAVKLLHADLAQDPGALERFSREAQAAGALESENIASVVDFGHAADDVPYIVMELLVGEDLAKLLAREGPLSVPRAVGLAIQACRGLDAAHAAGIVHRDLKPENLFVTRRGDGSDLLKILDFGIAKLARTTGDDDQPNLTQTGSTMGTPLYMPPEQARGEKQLDHRADIYALAVILYEALSGERPHNGESYNAILYHILTQAPRPLTSLRPSIPSDLADVVHRALSPDPGHRPQSAMELARAISRHAGRQVTPLTSQFELRVARGVPDAAEKTRMLPQATPPASAQPPDAAKPGSGTSPVKLRRRMLLGVTAGVGAMLSLATVLTLALTAGDRERDDEAVTSPASRAPATSAREFEPPEPETPTPQRIAAPSVAPAAAPEVTETQPAAKTPGAADAGAAPADTAAAADTAAVPADTATTKAETPPAARRPTPRPKHSRRKKPLFDEANPYD